MPPALIATAGLAQAVRKAGQPQGAVKGVRVAKKKKKSQGLAALASMTQLAAATALAAVSRSKWVGL